MPREKNALITKNQRDIDVLRLTRWYFKEWQLWNKIKIKVAINDPINSLLDWTNKNICMVCLAYYNCLDNASSLLGISGWQLLLLVIKGDMYWNFRIFLSLLKLADIKDYFLELVRPRLFKGTEEFWSREIQFSVEWPLSF